MSDIDDAAPLERARCSAMSKQTGERCGRAPIRGGTVCKHHGGSAPAVREAAARRVLEARVAGELVRQGYEPVRNPVEQLALLAGEVVAFKELCRQQMETLSRWEYSDAKDTEDVRALVAVYERALDRCERTLARMVSLGIEDRRVSVLESQGEEIAGILARVLDQLGLTVEQRARVAQVVPEELRALE